MITENVTRKQTQNPEYAGRFIIPENSVIMLDYSLQHFVTNGVPYASVARSEDILLTSPTIDQCPIKSHSRRLCVMCTYIDLYTDKDLIDQHLRKTIAMQSEVINDRTPCIFGRLRSV